MKMSKVAVVSVIVAACAVACAFDDYTGILNAGMSKAFAAEGERAERKTGELNGTVVSVEAFKAEKGITRFKLTLTTEGGQEAFIVGPANAQAYALVGSLAEGDKVRLSWVSEGGDQKWIRNIRKLEGDGGNRERGDRER